MRASLRRHGIDEKFYPDIRAGLGSAFQADPDRALGDTTRTNSGGSVALAEMNSRRSNSARRAGSVGPKHRY